MQVSGWTPVGHLVEEVHSKVVITGSNFPISSDFKCLWYGNGREMQDPMVVTSARLVSSSECYCQLESDLFGQVPSPATLHLTLDGGKTYE